MLVIYRVQSAQGLWDVSAVKFGVRTDRQLLLKDVFDVKPGVYQCHGS